MIAILAIYASIELSVCPYPISVIVSQQHLFCKSKAVYSFSAAETVFLNIQILHFQSVLLYKRPPLVHIIAHQYAEKPVCFAGIFQTNLQQRPRLGVHGSLPKLLGIHFAKSLKPLDFHIARSDLPYHRRNLIQRSGAELFGAV
jgi:hypothetical protein